MRMSSWLATIVCVVQAVRVASNSIQVGTVLFTTTDLVKKCWSESDKSLLRARLIMQDVLPDPSCVDFSKTDAILILLDYFHTCYDIIGVSTYGKMQNLMYLALSDAVGGYLRRFVLPLTRQAYYAGHVKYAEAKKVFQLYNDIKEFLKTNGVGWAEPQPPYKNFPVKPLVIPSANGDSSCKKLYTIELRGNLRCISGKTGVRSSLAERFRRDADSSSEICGKCGGLQGIQFKLPKQSPGAANASNACDTLLADLGQAILKNLTEDDEDETASSSSGDECRFPAPKTSRKRIIIPLPVLDDCATPHTIAVPFKKRPLRNLQNPNSAFIVERYYSTVLKCLISQKNTKSDIRNFNSEFYTWLVSQVFPHLSDEEWYPGFGGVLRITEAIKKFGTETTKQDPSVKDIGFMFSRGFSFNKNRGPKGEEETQSFVGGKERTRDVDLQDVPYHSRRHFLIAIFIIGSTVAFTLSACLFYFYAIRCRNVHPRGSRGGLQRVSSYSTESSRGTGRDEPKADKGLNFKFLVRFFRKTEKSRPTGQREESDRDDCSDLEESRKPTPTSKGGKEWHEYMVLGDSKKCAVEKISPELQEKVRLPRGQGDDFGMGYAAAFQRRVNPLWPCDPSSIRFEEVGPSILTSPGGDAREISGKALATLWKKPQGRLRRLGVPREFKGDEKSTRRRRGLDSKRKGHKVVRTPSESSAAGDTKSSTCCHSESSSRSQTTASNSSSRTQVEEKLSSTTIEFFDQVLGRRKQNKKPSTKESTEETETEEEDEEEEEEEEEEDEEASCSSRSGY